jgi:hypothetical protein
MTAAGMMAVGLPSVLLLLACPSGQTRIHKKSSPPSPAPAAENQEPATATRRGPYVVAGKTYYPPVALWYSDMHMEGGTRFVHLVDSRGRKLLACNDATSIINRRGDAFDRPIYIGGEHPTHKGSKPLPLGGADEQELYRVLRDWADRGSPLVGPPFPRELGTDYRAESAKAFLSFLEQHIGRHKPK